VSWNEATSSKLLAITELKLLAMSEIFWRGRIQGGSVWTWEVRSRG